MLYILVRWCTFYSQKCYETRESISCYTPWLLSDIKSWKCICNCLSVYPKKNKWKNLCFFVHQSLLCYLLSTCLSTHKWFSDLCMFWSDLYGLEFFLWHSKQWRNETVYVSVSRGFHSTGVKRMGGHGHDEPYYLHAKHMYNLDRMKHQKLKMSLSVCATFSIGISVPVYS